MAFYEALKRDPAGESGALPATAAPDEARRVLEKETLDLSDFALLLSPAAAPLLETAAQKARQVTRRQFGNVILLFTPMYVSDHCVNSCPYCSFAHQQAIGRHHLTHEAIEREAAAIAESGIRHILLLTGEAPGLADLPYLEKTVAILKKHFSSIALEIYPLDTDGYRRLAGAGADSLTIYQETYDEKVYGHYHKNGPKADFRFRLEAPERALDAGLRAVTIGPLLGLKNPYEEAVCAAFHLAWLRETYPWAELAVSLPRLRPVVSGFVPPHPVDDRAFVRLLTAFRLFMPECGITLSTRESAAFRDALLPLGVTKMSAGVSTAVGGHSGAESTGQFEIADTRSVDEVRNGLLAKGFQPVMVDWDHRLSELSP